MIIIKITKKQQLKTIQTNTKSIDKPWWLSYKRWVMSKIDFEVKPRKLSTRSLQDVISDKPKYMYQCICYINGEVADFYWTGPSKHKRGKAQTVFNATQPWLRPHQQFLTAILHNMHEEASKSRWKICNGISHLNGLSS